MAGPRPMAQTIQLIVKGDRQGEDIVNTFYFKHNNLSPVTLADMTDLASLFTTVVMPYLASCAHSDCRWTAITVTNLGDIPQTTVDYFFGAPIVGTRPAACLPGNVAIGVRRKTDLHGRSYRGRIMLAPPGTDDVRRDIITPTLQAVITTLLGQLLERFTVTSGKIFIPAAGSFKLVASRAIVSWLFDSVTDSMSTRLFDHGT